MGSSFPPEAEDDRRRQALHRIAILDAMITALDNRQRVLAVVERASDDDEAHAAVMREFQLNEMQATVVLDLQKRPFTPSQRQQITDERDQLLRQVRLQ